MGTHGRKRLLTLALLGGAALLGLLWQSPAYGGGPLLVGGNSGTPGQPFVWDTTSAISYHTDQGTLGNQSTAQADQSVREGFDVWETTVPTANISFVRSGDLGLDVNGSNHMSFFDNFLNSCNPPQPPAPANSVNAIVYDTDGQITEDILGVGESQSVLGFAGAVCIEPVTGRFVRGQAVLNGLFTDGLISPSDPAPNKFKEVFTHEFGHLIGLDHSQINVAVLDGLANRTPDNLFGLPLMFPVLLSSTPARVDQGFPPLAPDDEAWLSWLYPSATFNTTYGAISGTILFSDGITQLQGANVIARQVNDPATTAIDESRRFAVSVYSGFLYTDSPGQNVTGTNPGSNFGSRDPALIGAYEIPVIPEDYTVEVESFDPSFEGGSSVGPIGEPFPLPGPPEFFTNPESSTDDPSAPGAVVLVTATGAAVPDINIILNNTPSRFDAFESARLWLREPAPAWVRRKIPLDSTVAG